MSKQPIQKEFEFVFDIPEPPLTEAKLATLTVDEIWNSLSDQTIRKFAEDNRIERKSCRIQPRDLAEVVCMWANTPPDGGIIILGQKDKKRGGGFEGMVSAGTSTLNDLENCGIDHCHSAKYQTKRIPVENDDHAPDFVLAYRVQYHPGKVVEMENGTSYWRKGDRQVRLEGEEKRCLQVDKGQVQWEQEPCGIAYPDGFHLKDGVLDFVERVKKATGIVRETRPPHVLVNHKLGVNSDYDFAANNACALLFAKDTRDVCPGNMIRFQQFTGTVQLAGARRNVTIDLEFRGNLPTILADFNKFFLKQVRSYTQLDPSGRFVTVPEYPQEVWYEAIVNACVHRSYAIAGMNIWVKMFDDRLEIESPGAFPPFVTAENIYFTHHRRNYFLMDAMKVLGYVRCENEGVKRMRDAMQEAGLPTPIFEQKEVGQAFVRVTLKNNLKVRTRIGANADSRLSDNQRLIVLHCIDHGKVNVSEVQSMLSITNWASAKKELEDLRLAGLLDFISRNPKDTHAHYILR